MFILRENKSNLKIFKSFISNKSIVFIVNLKWPYMVLNNLKRAFTYDTKSDII